MIEYCLNELDIPEDHVYRRHQLAMNPRPEGVEALPVPEPDPEASSSPFQAITDASKYYIGRARRKIGGAVRRVGTVLKNVDAARIGSAPIKGYGGLKPRPYLLVP